ncbi:sla2 Src-like adaptor 2 [Malassezia sp. CBS 17886]|nr:sla2 Src-like adaptor 2 [Malassezia sp. CBS 17886]
MADSSSHRPLTGAGRGAHAGSRALADPLVHKLGYALTVLSAMFFVIALMSSLGAVPSSRAPGPATSTAPGARCNPFLQHGVLMDVPYPVWKPFDPACPTSPLLPDMLGTLASASAGLTAQLRSGSVSYQAREELQSVLRNRTVLLVGDAVDRGMVQSLCAMIGQASVSVDQSHPWGASLRSVPSHHGGGTKDPVDTLLADYCYEPQYDILFSSFYHYGADVDDRWRNQMMFYPPSRFEHRVSDLLQPYLRAISTQLVTPTLPPARRSPQPDLVVFSSSYWDLASWGMEDANAGVSLSTGLSEARLSWWRSRMVDMVDALRTYVGTGTRIVWRSAHMPAVDVKASVEWLLTTVRATPQDATTPESGHAFVTPNRVAQLNEARAATAQLQGTDRVHGAQTPAVWSAGNQPPLASMPFGELLVGHLENQESLVKLGVTPYAYVYWSMVLEELREAVSRYADHIIGAATRPLDRDRAEQDLAVHLRKATNADETAPKQKHAIVYTWDNKSSHSVWSGLRVLPILNDEVQTFKALIVVHKVLQEGHPTVLREAQAQSNWLETCARMSGNSVQQGYGTLIRAYVSFILAKLRFHRVHKEFNGLFEYEEYVSLKNIDNPDEGYETIMELMSLQDRIEKFQKQVFQALRGRKNNECQISSLVPLVKESYGVYKFLTSMLRAMHRRTDALDALEPLRGRYAQQHHELRRFYFECASLKFLTSLINVPKLNVDPPNLLAPPPDVPELPPREADSKPATPPPATPTQAEIDEQARLLKQYEDKQRDLKDAEAREQQRQTERAEAQEREFEAQQRAQAEQQRVAQEQLMRSQAMNHIHGRAAELERDLLLLRGQYERDQLMLQQYDGRVRTLETELASAGANAGAQFASKDELLQQLQEQVNTWRNKYEALAKLYSQLRNEHLDLLAKYKQAQLKAGSAQEAINKMERMERDVKAKNLELSDMIRDRDRARLELDRMRGGEREEVDRLKRELRFAEERAQDALQARGTEVSSIMARMNAQIGELENELRTHREQLSVRDTDHAKYRDDRDAEVLILQEGMDDTIRQLNELRLQRGDSEDAVNAQVDTIILDNTKKLSAIIDSILQSCADKVDGAVFELESPTSAAHSSATPEYVLSLIEKGQASVNEFAAIFSLYTEQQRGGEHVEVIKSANQLAHAAAESLVSFKGVLRFGRDEDAVEQLTALGVDAGSVLLRYFLNLQSFRLTGLHAAQRGDVAARQSMEATQAFARLADATSGLVKSAPVHARDGDLGNLVEREMMQAAATIEQATQRVQQLLARDRTTSRYSTTELQVHDAILEAALAIMHAVGGLIRAATESQEEIVAKGRGSSSVQQFYKKHNRWTDGLISAARAVAFATTMLIEAADGVIMGTHSLEQLIVASNEVSAATVQLVAASRVKSEFMSKTQDRLERAAKAVTDACKALVKQVRVITDRGMHAEDQDYSQMATHEFKVREMEQQVEVLKLEKELTQARRTLGAMRRAGYHATEEE